VVQKSGPIRATFANRPIRVEPDTRQIVEIINRYRDMVRN
jgi:hypothetical protein